MTETFSLSSEKKENDFHRKAKRKDVKLVENFPHRFLAFMSENSSWLIYQNK